MNAFNRRFALPLAVATAAVAVTVGLGKPLSDADAATPGPVASVSAAVEKEASELRRDAARMRWLVTLPGSVRRRCTSAC